MKTEDVWECYNSNAPLSTNSSKCPCCLYRRTEQLVQDIDPEVVRAALRDFVQELKDTQRDKDDAKIEVSNLTRQVRIIWKISFVTW